MGKIGIPDGKDIGASDGKKGVFENEDTITKVVFGSNCTFVGDDAFEYCESLSEINEDNVIEAIGTNAFAGTCISSANFDALTTLESGAFKGCEELESIIMPNVTSIPDDAFKGCEKLKDINLDNCTSIGNNAFEDCENIEQITLSKCKEIKDFAFINCKKLTRVYINMEEEEVIKLGTYPFHIYDDSDGNSDVIGKINENLLFFIPPKKLEEYTGSDCWESYKNNMISMVKDNQILYKTKNNEIIGTIPENGSDSDGNSDSDGVITYEHSYESTYGLITFNNGSELKSLNDKMFKGNTNLTYIYLPSKCERIGEDEFNKCTQLSDIRLPDNIKYIDDSAFAYCAFKSFEIPETIEILGDGIFKGCKNIEKFKGNFVTNDGKSVVCNEKLICVLPNYDKKQLNISDIDKNITKLGKGCLYECENLIRVDIPSNITEIGDNAFEGCVNLREIHFHGDVPTLGEDIFGKIKDINKDIKIFVPEAKFKGYYENIQSGYLQYLRPMPENKTMIYFIDGDKMVDSRDTKCIHDTREDGKTITYYKTPNLNSTVIVESYYADKDVKEVILAESYTGVNSGAFKNCQKLTYVYLNNNITTLGSSCFYGCTSLTGITIPDSVTKIGNSAFYGCASLKRVDITDLSTWCKISFGNGYSNPLCNGAKLYLNGSELTNITIPSNITEIKDYAFYNYISLTNITIPNSVTDIGKDSFESCVSLGSVTIPNSVTSIGADAFLNCKELEYVKIASLSDWCKINFGNSSANPLSNNSIDNIKTILCDKNNFPITNGTISNVGEIKDYTFYNYTSLKRIKYANIEKVGNFAFCGCNQLEEVVIDDEVTSIGIKAFYDCKKLTTFEMPEYVTSIGNAAFYGCKSLPSITIPNSVISIGYLAFMDCAGELIIKNKTLVENNASLGYIPFLRASNFNKISIGDNITKIGKKIFCGLASIESVTIPNSVTLIDDSAFEGCPALESVTIGNAVTSIGDGAFANCTSLTSITIPNNVKTIGSSAFYKCTSLTSATIGYRVTSIGEYAFYKCTSLTSVYCRPTTPPQVAQGSRLFDNNASGRKIYVPLDSVSMYRIVWSSYKSYIEGYDFAPPNTEIWYTSSNGDIITPNAIDVFDANIISNTYDSRKGIIKFDSDITRIGDLAFYGCDNITSITIPDSVTTIGEGAFSSCSGLTSIVIPDNVKTIGYQAFYNCSGLMDVTIGKGVTNIGDLAFYDCGKLSIFYGKFTSGDYRCLIINGILHSFAPAGLSNYTIPDNVTEIGERAFYGCVGLTGITIPDSVTKIGNLAFGNCSNLTNIIIPDSVEVIGYSAFFNCKKLTTSTIGSGVTEIGYYAFYNCNQLKDVYCNPVTPPTAKCADKDPELWSAFGNNHLDLKIHVPKKAFTKYKILKYWSDYADYIVIL